MKTLIITFLLLIPITLFAGGRGAPHSVVIEKKTEPVENNSNVVLTILAGIIGVGAGYGISKYKK